MLCKAVAPVFAVSQLLVDNLVHPVRDKRGVQKIVTNKRVYLLCGIRSAVDVRRLQKKRNQVEQFIAVFVLALPCLTADCLLVPQRPLQTVYLV